MLWFLVIRNLFVSQCIYVRYTEAYKNVGGGGGQVQNAFKFQVPN